MKKHFLLLMAAMAVNLCVMAQAPTYDTLYVYQDCDLNPKTLPGEFWVATGKKVRFSQGNLQFNCKSKKWRFATYQYETLKELNTQVADGADVWIDSFNFGSSGYNGVWPYEYTRSNGSGDIIGSNAECDWGIRNPIINGGNKAGLWRTLTESEWRFLFDHNTYKLVKLDGEVMIMLCPDGWRDEDESSVVGDIIYDGKVESSFTSITLFQYSQLEEAGAVFIPQTGSRTQNGTTFTNDGFWYWTASLYVPGQAKYVYTVNYVPTFLNRFTTVGLSVRLVQDL